MPDAIIDGFNKTGDLLGVNDDGSINIGSTINTVSVSGAYVGGGRDYDSLNSTSTNITANGSFVGDWVNTLNYISATMQIQTDVDSATNGFKFQTGNGSIATHEHNFTITSGTFGKHYTFTLAGQFYRVVYINGTSNQGEFELSTTLSKTDTTHSHTHAVDFPIDSNHEVQLTRSVLVAKNPAGNYINIEASCADNLRVSTAEDGLSIAKGCVKDTTFIHKFGNAPDFDIIDGDVDIWDGANDGGINAMTYTYSTTADINSITSTNSTNVQSIELQGLDADYLSLTQTAILNGSGFVGLGSPFIRVFRMTNTGSSDILGDVYNYVSGPTTAGIPNTTSDIRAIINNGNNQTLMAMYTIPSGVTGYMRDWYASTAGARKTSVHEIHLTARPFNGVFQMKHKSSLVANGTSYIQHTYVEPEVFNAMTDLEMHANTDEDIASISAGFDIVLIDN